MCHDEVKANGWTSVPANAGAIFKDLSFIDKVVAMQLDDIKFPYEDPIVAMTLQYAKIALHPETFNHSMRVYYFGMVISKQQFPEQAASLNPATWALTCLLHDLGTAEQNLTATRMSFDIYGGIKALSTLKKFGATSDQAEAVSEAIIRHEDMGVDGTITYFGQLIQLATTYDNTGVHPHVKGFEKLIHDTTRAQINEAHPRMKWCKFFSTVIRKEEAIKPWCHSTHLVDFDREIETNTLMRQWE
ncbi:cyanamide hydratase [Aspergillus sclerotioniger CBS 115572]|uniref:Cyanamide hydratase n=1 Tax=Aspergillus sclerotioniger CBS 115572 TaxID=1450535 RepID=A0A317WUT8_9EURO|nr:cyanamide hydratase [Aspergillus sclerotioniger CBS 115572]PWY88020.1 cyanamide hydratase [Aspergillus sclerotioniger CBS 115572]